MNRKVFVPVWKMLVLTAVVLSLAAGTGTAAGTKKPLSYDAYDGWRSIQGTQLSRDGQWLVCALVPEDGDGELAALNLQTNKEYRSPRGKQPVITADGKFAVFAIAPVKAEVDKAKKEKKKPEEQPKAGLGIMNLATGEVTTVDRVKSFKVPEESGAFVAYLMEPPLAKPGEKKEEAKKEEPKKEEKKKEPGTDLVIRDLASGKETKIAEVVEYAWPKNGAWLAYGVSSKTPENDGAFAWEAASGRTVALLQGLGNYKNLTFDEKGGQLAFTSDRDDYKSEKSASKLYYWQPPAAAAGASVANMTSAYGGIRWGSGMSRAFQYEKTQSRIGAPLWSRALQFVENSPLFWVERVKTPYLTIHDDDDAVPWYQGIEFFSALRRLGKEAYLFDFNGEKHGLRERENQKYWTVHMDEFFDHFLLGKPMPEWMAKGVPWLERGKRDIDALYKKPEEKKAEEPKK
jgi:hypothetical protein